MEEIASNGTSEFLPSYCSEFGAAAFLRGLCHKCESVHLCLSICLAAMVELPTHNELSTKEIDTKVSLNRVSFGMGRLSSWTSCVIVLVESLIGIFGMATLILEFESLLADEKLTTTEPWK